MTEQPKGRKLTTKRRMFIEEHLRLWNDAEAARTIGYGIKCAGQPAYENILNQAGPKTGGTKNSSNTKALATIRTFQTSGGL